jgi:peptidoglycan-N-acetylglucosamine deacetylase
MNKSLFFILFMFFLNYQSIDTLLFNLNLTSNFEKENFKSNDSISNIPNSFLDFQKNSKGFCIVHGSLEKKEIALTFDDGPTDVSVKIIKILNKFNAKGTFFWVGERIKNNESTIKKAIKKGHLIANHSWNHENGYLFSNQLLWESQVEKTLTEFSNHGINDVAYYRPPFGGITQNQIDFLASKNIKTVLWSISTMDWDPKQNSDNLMFQKFKQHLHPGAIVLLHDFDYGNLNSKLKDLEKILKFGKSKGYKFVTVAQLNLQN